MTKIKQTNIKQTINSGATWIGWTNYRSFLSGFQKRDDKQLQNGWNTLLKSSIIVKKYTLDKETSSIAAVV